MSCLRVGNGVVCVSPEFWVTVGKRRYRVEWHSRFGPSFLRKNGDVWYPKQGHPLWKAAATEYRRLAKEA